MRTSARFTWPSLAFLLVIGFVPGSKLSSIVAASPAGGKQQAVVTVHSAGRGYPRISLADGKELEAGNVTGGSLGSQPATLACADFDSDGVLDVITSDRNGLLRVYRGVPDPRMPRVGARAIGYLEAEPLRLLDRTFRVSATPDFLFTGDFNADGHKDVLVASRGGDSLYLLPGDGAGNLAAEVRIAIGGAITAVEANEIGRLDGQTDVVVATTGPGGAQVLVFEHPEGAFKYRPEIFRLSKAATALAIGNLDGDSYRDIAVATGAQLTIIHGRGQAYPWDMIKEHNLKRPAALVETRQMPVEIVGLAVGNFSARRGKSLALLAADGSLLTLETTKSKASTAVPENVPRSTKKPAFVPAGGEGEKFAVAVETLPTDEKVAAELGMMMADVSVSGRSAAELVREKMSAMDSGKRPPGEQAGLKAEKLLLASEKREAAKAAFLKTLSAKPAAPLADWTLQTIQKRLSGAARAQVSRKLTIARVSTSDTDDLVLLDADARQIQIVMTAPRGGTPTPEIVALDVASKPVAILPMRLNGDALSDLVVLREGSSNLSIVPSVPANIFVVDTADDSSVGACDGSEPCSLRRAITIANQTPGADEIRFNIGGGGPQTITLASELPTILEAVYIDGGSQPGFAGVLSIEITGANLTGAVDGLRIQTSDCDIRGMAINQMPSVVDENNSQIGGNAIAIVSTSSTPNVGNNYVVTNYLGTDRTGYLDRGNSATGVNIFDSDENFIASNILSGNGTQELNGVGVAITGGDNNNVLANYIGVNASGNGKLGNSYGIFLTGRENVIGSDDASAGNTISGNGESSGFDNRCFGQGMAVFALFDANTLELLTAGNIIKGNRIGTDSSGASGLGNCTTGIRASPVTTTVIGSIAPNGRNIVSGNGDDAIWCADFDEGVEGGYCYIIGNDVGTDITGTLAIPNDRRNGCVGFCIVTDTLWISPDETQFATVGSPGGTTPGGDCTGLCNLISGNDNPFSPGGSGGIRRTGLGTVGIFNNYVGTNRSGTAALPNINGVSVVFGTFTDIGGAGVDEKGAVVLLGNLLSGNVCSGATVSDSFGGASSGMAGEFNVKGNLIGTTASGNSALPNSPQGGTCLGGGLGILSVVSLVQVGGTDLNERNIISGNGNDGISVFERSGETKILNNYIGVGKDGAPLGNSGKGIVVVNAAGLQIGGTGTNEANLIRNNGSVGVSIERFQSGSQLFSVAGVRVVGNVIADNGGLGIDLTNTTQSQQNPDGVTPNDCRYDIDEGANRLQNYPELSAATFNGDGTVTVEGTLRSSPDDTFTIDFYSNAAADPTQFGEGETYIGSTAVRTDGNGFFAFTFTSIVPVASSRRITATATDADGNTSEFSRFTGDGMSGNRAKAELRAAPDQPTCIEPIVVNITTDEEDANPLDGLCDVDTSTPGNQCSLRAAIQEANARDGFDMITFNIPGAGGHTIAPTNRLPPISKPVFINGASQPGYSDDLLPKILLSGVNDSSPTNIAIGLSFISGSGSTSTERGSIVVGLAINGWRKAAIQFSGSPEAEVQSCHIGFDLGGAATVGSGNANGIVVQSSNDVRIGATLGADGNVISNSNVSGVSIEESRDCIIQSNKIGTGLNGISAVPNVNGISLEGATTTNTQIVENLVSGNSSGITIEGSRPSGVNNRIIDNLIGTTADGMSALPNSFDGISVTNSTNNLIKGNTISGHNEGGQSAAIHLGYLGFGAGGADSNNIYNNKIGVGLDGSTAIPNRYGVFIRNSSRNQIGSPGQPRNKISGNIEAGIHIEGINDLEANQNKISNNDIGVSAGNQKDGIRFKKGANSNEISDNTISGNGIYGVVLLQEADTNKIHDNRIGTGAANRIGVGIKSWNNFVYKNVISDNTDYNVAVGFIELDLTKGISGTIEENKIYDNRIENSKIGIAVTESAKNNFIGRNVEPGSAGNKITNHRNGRGIGIHLGTVQVETESIFPSGNQFYGNIVGEVGPNSFSNNVGMVITKAKDNIIGSETNGLGNVFVANEEDGIKISPSEFSPNNIHLVKNNLIAGNFIGFNPGSPKQFAAGNGRNGIYVVGTVGRNDIKNNIIGYNRANGISVADVSAEGGVSLQIAGNQIGVARLGDLIRIPNLNAGIKLENAEKVLVGSSLTSDPKNIISGNVGSGVLITGANSISNIVNNSIIGTDDSGTLDIGNAGDGVSIVGGERNIIGGNSPIENTIAGNRGNGVLLQTARFNKIQGNLIGIVQLGNEFRKLPNDLNGISVDEGESNEIGHNSPLLKNIIGGNASSGIALRGANTYGTTIIGNFIGTDDSRTNLGNTLHGVLITDGAGNTNVGGLGVNTGNKIAYNGLQLNGGSGVGVSPTAGTGNLIDPNEIHDNAGLGIDIGLNGHTPNDFGDADEGPNRLQNYPEIVERSVNPKNELVVAYRMTSAPENSDYGADGIYIEFFKADASSEGAQFLGSDHYTVADYNNGSPLVKEVNLGDIGALGFNPKIDKLTASATDAGGNTSEFLGPTEVRFGSESYSNESAGTATITVTRTGSSFGTATVNYATVAGGTATDGSSCTEGVDYITTSGTLTFVDGDTSETFPVQLCSGAVANGPDQTKVESGKRSKVKAISKAISKVKSKLKSKAKKAKPASKAESGETIHLALSDPTGASLGSPSTAVLTITAAAPSAPNAFSAGGPPPDTATVGYPYAGYTFIANGSPPPTYAVQAGPLPDGFSLSTTGALSGANPTTAGTFSGIVVRASNSAGFLDTAAFTITVNPAIAFTTTTLPDWTKDRSGYNQTIVVTGGTGAKTFTVTSGTLPTDLNLDPNSGAITGTPTVANTFNFTVTATDSLGATTAQPYTVVINPVITLSPATLADAIPNQSYSQTITADGGTGAKTFAITDGALPAGLNIDAKGGAITGTATTVGTYNFSVTAADSVGATGSLVYSLLVDTPPIAGPDDVGTPKNTPVNAPLVKLMLNDSDPDAGDTINITGVNTPSSQGGTVVLGSGVITYTPANDFVGQDTFTYILTDNHGVSVVGLVRVEVGISSALNIISIERTPTEVVLQCAGIPGASYIVQAADDAGGPYIDLSAPIAAGDNGRFEYHDTTQPQPMERFYKVRSNP